MAKNLSNRKPNVKNIRPNCLKATKKKQGLKITKYFWGKNRSYRK